MERTRHSAPYVPDPSAPQLQDAYTLAAGLKRGIRYESRIGRYRWGAWRDGSTYHVRIEKAGAHLAEPFASTIALDAGQYMQDWAYWTPIEE
jgi:hypothetical protein